MRRLFVLSMILLLASVSWSEVDTSSLSQGARVAIELASGRVVIGRFVSADARAVEIDVAAEGAGVAVIRIPVGRIAVIRAVFAYEVASSPGMAPPAPATRPGLETPSSPVRDQEAEVELSDHERELLGLLVDFPPRAGWSDERYHEIARRDLLYDLRPTLKEVLFREIYPDWIDAKALSVRLDRGEAPGRWHQALAPAAAWMRFSSGDLWSEDLYGPLRRRLFVEDYEIWLRGKALAKELAGADAEKLTEEQRSPLFTYGIFPEGAGWNEARRDALREELAEAPGLTDDERLFVIAFPDYLEGKAAFARADAAKRAPDISYDEVKPLSGPRDLPSENISTDTVRPLDVNVNGN